MQALGLEADFELGAGFRRKTEYARDEGALGAMADDLGVGALASNKPRASTTMDFPEPVSPVRALRPGPNSASPDPSRRNFRLHPQQHAQFRIRPTGRESHGQE